MAKAEKKVGEYEFESGGKNYRFIIFKFYIPGFEESTAKEALLNKDALAYLVKEKSGVIEEVA